MIIAVSYKDGEIYEHFGHAEYFAIYTTNNDQTEITGKKVDIDRHRQKRDVRQ